MTFKMILQYCNRKYILSDLFSCCCNQRLLFDCLIMIRHDKTVSVILGLPPNSVLCPVHIISNVYLKKKTVIYFTKTMIKILSECLTSCSLLVRALVCLPIGLSLMWKICYLGNSFIHR